MAFPNLSNGLFGMGGLGGFAPSMPQQMQGLIDPQELKRAQLKQLLLSGGLSMLGQGPSELPINLGTSIGQGLQAGVKAADQTGKDYRDTAYQTFQINQDADKQAYGRQQDERGWDWKNSQFDYAKNQDSINNAWREKQLAAELAAKKAQNGPEYGLNPVWLQNAEGKWMLVQPSKDGSAPRPMEFPQGYNPAPQNRTVDTGTGYVTMPTRGEGAPVGGVIPKNVAEAEAQKEIGEGRGKAIVAAPGDIAAANNALDILNQIKVHPYLDRGVGGTSLANVIPGTGGYDFQNIVDQAKSGAFLTAIQQMRGLGSLSNAEGQTATAAVTRMNTATSKEAFLSALSDYERVIQQGKAKAEARLGGVQSVPPNAGGSQNLSDDELIKMYGG